MKTRTLSELAEICGAVLQGDGQRRICGPASLRHAASDQISFYADEKYRGELDRTSAGAVVVPREFQGREDLALLRCDRPDRAFSRIVESFEEALEPPPSGVHATALLAPDVELGGEVSVGPLCVVGRGARLGEGCVLHPRVVIGEGACLGPGCELHPGVVVHPRVRIGSRCVLRAGAVIGSDGFGFDPSEEGWVKVPQCGTVILGDDVEVGANSTVDRGRFEATRVGNGVKIDNLVQVAHNVEIGDHALLCAQVGIAGSTLIDEWVVLAGQVGVNGHLHIGRGARVGGHSGITSDIPAGAEYFGLPAREMRQEMRLIAARRHVPELRQQLRRLQEEAAAREERLAELERRLARLEGGPR